jgi:hypothetical protein
MVLPKYPIVQDCTDYPRVIHEEHVFAVTLRDAIRQSTMDLGQPPPAYLQWEYESGMLVSYEVRDHPLHGRGLYATEDIPANTPVWDGYVQKWYSIKEFESFLQYLPPPLQCDVIMWAYPFRGSHNKVVMAMDQGSYMNDGGTMNISNIESVTTTTLREIQRGEEMVEDYSKYVDLDGQVEWFHELRASVFGQGEYTEQGAPLLKQNDYQQILRTKTTATATAVVVDYLFDELGALVDRPLFLDDCRALPLRYMSLTSWLAMMMMMVLSFIPLILAILSLKRRILLSKSKMHVQ